jgi:hypothetical protein
MTTTKTTKTAKATTKEMIPVIIESAKKEAEKLVEQAGSLRIKNPAQLEEAGLMLTKVSAKIKVLDTERKEMTKPLDDSKKRIMAWFNEPIETLQGIQAGLKQAMLAYQKAVQAKQLAKEQAIREQLAKEQEVEVEDVQLPVSAPKNPIGAFTNSTIRKTWECEVIDETQVPREFLMVDTAKLKKYATAMKADAKVAGVRFFEKEGIVSR